MGLQHPCGAFCHFCFSVWRRLSLQLPEMFDGHGHFIPLSQIVGGHGRYHHHSWGTSYTVAPVLCTMAVGQE